MAESHSRDRLRILAAHEEWALANPLRERAVLLDSAGRVITRKEGERGGIDWTVEALAQMVGRVDLLTHSHPSGKSVGEDDLGLAVGLNAREVSVVTPDRRYRLYRVGDTWPQVDQLLSVITVERTGLIVDMIAARDGGRIDDDEIERTFHHVLWQRVADRLPNHLRYEVERRG